MGFYNKDEEDETKILSF